MKNLELQIPNASFRSDKWQGPAVFSSAGGEPGKQHHAVYVLALAGREGISRIISHFGDGDLDVRQTISRAMWLMFAIKTDVPLNGTEEELNQQKATWLRLLDNKSDDEIATATKRLKDSQFELRG